MENIQSLASQGRIFQKAVLQTKETILVSEEQLTVCPEVTFSEAVYIQFPPFCTDLSFSSGTKKKMSDCVAQPSLDLTLQTRLASDSQSSACFHIPHAGMEG